MLGELFDPFPESMSESQKIRYTIYIVLFCVLIGLFLLTLWVNNLSHKMDTHIDQWNQAYDRWDKGVKKNEIRKKMFDEKEGLKVPDPK